MAEPQVPRLELPFFAPDWTELRAWSKGQRERELAGLARRVHGGGAGMDRAADVSDCLLAASKKGKEKEIKLKEKK